MPQATRRISSEAVRKATGRGWEEWLALLDEAGAARWTHKDIAAYLATAHGIAPWWSQMLTVGYERARDLRAYGQTAAAGFEVGAQRTLPLAPGRAWELVTSPRGLALWLGEAPSLDISVGAAYATADGTRGVFRVVNPPSHLRLTWQTAGWDAPSTLQLRVVAAGAERTSLRFHHERLADERARAAMRRRWQDALAELAALL